MSEIAEVRTGGCLCGALRYVARGEPIYAGYCYCADCRKASGSGFIGFMGFPASAVTFTGATLQYTSLGRNGGPAVRNSCATCGSLVFGGIVGEDTSHTIYAGSLDDAASFVPEVAIFTEGRPDWAMLPPGLQTFPGMPA